MRVHFYKEEIQLNFVPCTKQNSDIIMNLKGKLSKEPSLANNNLKPIHVAGQKRLPFYN